MACSSRSTRVATGSAALSHGQAGWVEDPTLAATTGGVIRERSPVAAASRASSTASDGAADEDRRCATTKAVAVTAITATAAAIATETITVWRRLSLDITTAIGRGL